MTDSSSSYCSSQYELELRSSLTEVQFFAAMASFSRFSKVKDSDVGCWDCKYQSVYVKKYNMRPNQYNPSASTIRCTFADNPYINSLASANNVDEKTEISRSSHQFTSEKSSTYRIVHSHEHTPPISVASTNDLHESDLAFFAFRRHNHFDLGWSIFDKKYAMKMDLVQEYRVFAVTSREKGGEGDQEMFYKKCKTVETSFDEVAYSVEFEITDSQKPFSLEVIEAFDRIACEQLRRLVLNDPFWAKNTVIISESMKRKILAGFHVTQYRPSPAASLDRTAFPEYHHASPDEMLTMADVGENWIDRKDESLFAVLPIPKELPMSIVRRCILLMFPSTFISVSPAMAKQTYICLYDPETDHMECLHLMDGVGKDTMKTFDVLMFNDFHVSSTDLLSRKQRCRRLIVTDFMASFISISHKQRMMKAHSALLQMCVSLIATQEFPFSPDAPAGCSFTTESFVSSQMQIPLASISRFALTSSLASSVSPDLYIEIPQFVYSPDLNFMRPSSLQNMFNLVIMNHLPYAGIFEYSTSEFDQFNVTKTHYLVPTMQEDPPSALVERVPNIWLMAYKHLASRDDTIHWYASEESDVMYDIHCSSNRRVQHPASREQQLNPRKNRLWMEPREVAELNTEFSRFTPSALQDMELHVSITSRDGIRVNSITAGTNTPPRPMGHASVLSGHAQKPMSMEDEVECPLHIYDDLDDDDIMMQKRIDGAFSDFHRAKMSRITDSRRAAQFITEDDLEKFMSGQTTSLQGRLVLRRKLRTSYHIVIRHTTWKHVFSSKPAAVDGSDSDGVDHSLIPLHSIISVCEPWLAQHCKHIQFLFKNRFHVDSISGQCVRLAYEPSQKRFLVVDAQVVGSLLLTMRAEDFKSLVRRFTNQSSWSSQQIQATCPDAFDVGPSQAFKRPYVAVVLPSNPHPSATNIISSAHSSPRTSPPSSVTSSPVRSGQSFVEFKKQGLPSAEPQQPSSIHAMIAAKLKQNAISASSSSSSSSSSSYSSSVLSQPSTSTITTVTTPSLVSSPAGAVPHPPSLQQKGYKFSAAGQVLLFPMTEWCIALEDVLKQTGSANKSYIIFNTESQVIYDTFTNLIETSLSNDDPIVTLVIGQHPLTFRFQGFMCTDSALTRVRMMSRKEFLPVLINDCIGPCCATSGADCIAT